jgi:phenylalanyl-tRNA synthetase beta chain
MPQELARHFGGGDETLTLRNPIAADLGQMRPSILGNLLQAAARNAAQGYPDLGLFEIGPVYHSSKPEGQALMAGLLRCGQTPCHWADKARAIDLYDIKGDLFAALATCGLNAANLQLTLDAPAWYHPAQSGCLRQGQKLIACFGTLHPALQSYGENAGPVAIGEIWLEALPSMARATAKPALMRASLQPVRRDFAFVVDQATTAEAVVKTIRQTEKQLITEVNLFDIFTGGSLGEGKKSLAFAVTFQPRDESLTEAMLEKLETNIVTAVQQKTGGVLR